MIPVAAPLDDPVRVYYDSLEGLHLKVRKNTPFTYLAYKSMIPAKEDDFIGLAYKVSYYITFKFFIHMGSHMGSPLFGFIPFAPLVLDLLWVGYRWIREWRDGLPSGFSGISSKDAATDTLSQEQTSPLTTLFFLSVGLLAIHYLDKFPEY